MNRRLLPYEYQLIEALGVSKEEYLEFVALQQEYKDPKAGTALDIRGADGGATAMLVLTIVGTLFQVGAALLAPKPNIPSIGASNKLRTRQQRFAPSFGFNGAPELAAYGDPVNLVYTSKKDNSDGGVRVSGSLVWSAVDNFGSSQFMQLLFILGAAQIKSIDENRTAFGSLALSQLDPSTVFLFYPKYADGEFTKGQPHFSDTEKDNLGFYPDDLKSAEDSDVCQIISYQNATRNGVQGFSQAYSPTTSSSLGIYDPVPIKVEMQTRDSEGEEQDGPIGIILLGDGWEAKDEYNPKRLDKNGNEIAADKIQVRFESKEYRDGGDDEVAPLALNFRRQAVNALDFGSTYMLGSAKFRLLSFGTGSESQPSRDPDDGDVTANFECVETGLCPSFNYGSEIPVNNVKAEKKKLQNDLKILKNELEEAVPPSGRGSFVSSASDTKEDEDEDGIVTNVPDDKNIADQYNIKPMRNTNNSTVEGEDRYKLGKCVIDYNYTDAVEVSWVDQTKKKRNLSIDTAGSVEYTEYLESRQLNDPLTVKTESVRKTLRQDIRRLNLLIRLIESGDLDDDIETPWSFAFSYKEGAEFWDQKAYPGELSKNLQQSLGWNMENRLRADARGTHGKETDDFGKFTLYYINERLESIKTTRDYLYAKIDETNVEASAKLKDTAFENNTPSGTIKRFPSITSIVGKNSIGKRVDRIDQQLERWEALKTKRESKLAAEVRNQIVDRLEDKTTAFTTPRIPENRGRNEISPKDYSKGRDELETELDSLPSTKKMVDVNSLKPIESAFAILKKKKKGTIRDIKRFLKKWDDCIASADNNFFVKALVKAESAAYETVSEVDQVKFSIKSKLFRRVSGRQLKYGDTPADQKYSLGDNGIHGRQAFFRFSYKKADQGDDGWTVHPALFAIRQSSESEAYNDFNFYAPSRAKYAFKLDPVYDVGSEIQQNGQKTFAVLDSHERMNKKNNNPDILENGILVGDKSGGFVWWNGIEKASLTKIEVDNIVVDNTFGFPNLEERGPKLTNEWDVFSVNTDTQVQFSFESGPELALTAVTEQQIASTVNELGTGVYKDLSLFSLSMFANRGIQDLRNVTAFVTEGKLSHRITFASDEISIAPSQRSTSYAPDIFADTVLDKINGIGRYAPSTVLDKSSLWLAKNFCENNNLPTELDFDSGESVKPITLNMDGVIADQSSWRDFWVNNAPFSLLEFARKNGKETLVPALPVSKTGQAADANGYPISLTISALFTTGNILEDSYKEEFLDYGASTQDLVASIIYREESSKSIFQRKRTVNVRRLDIADLPSSIRETFDLSAFVTSRQQAIMFGKMLVNQRRYVRRGVEFKTFPSSNPIEPGAFIYVDIGFNSWDKTSSGVVSKDESLNSPLQNIMEEGLYNFLFYNRDSANVDAKNDVEFPTGLSDVLAGRAGQLYVMGRASREKRVFRITEVEMDEDGEVTVRAIEYPCDDQQRARVADFRPSLFKVS